MRIYHEYEILQVLLFAHLFYLLSLMLPPLGNRLAVATHKHALAQEFFKRPQRPSFVTSTFVATHHADAGKCSKGRAPLFGFVPQTIFGNSSDGVVLGHTEILRSMAIHERIYKKISGP